ncbi:MAG: hypothetical protein IKV62_04245 [Bacteroidales bacterium]|nr:hypothetical protein [Bacteroidales bacterium]
MKKITSLLALGLLLVLSCEKEGPTTVNEITDLYTAPADARVMTLTSANSTWSTDRRYFDLNFSELSTTLVGFDALLAPGQYVIGSDQIGNAINTTVNGLNGQNAGEGFFTVNSKDGQYAITATINGHVYYWTGALPFEADPNPTPLTVVLSAQSNLANGVNSLTMSLATEGISQEFDMSTWQTVWKGEGGYLALDIYSEDGYLHEGTYKASAEGGVINAGEFGIGYDTTMQWGDQVYEMKDWGTCWWDVKDGAATATKITDGLVNVTKDGKVWTITWGAQYPVEVIFEGEIPALTKPDKPDGPAQLDYLYTEEVTPGDGLDLHAVSITDKGGNLVAYLELQTEPGATDLSGDYPSTSYASAPGQMRDGYFIDLSVFGMEGTMEGGSYYIVDGEKQFIGAGTATVVVTKVAEGAYRFTCEFFDYAAAGPDYVPGGEGEGGDDDVTGDVVLKITSGLTYTMEDVTSTNTASDGSALSGMTLWRVSVSNGSEEVAEFDLGTAAGSEDLAGEYTVMSYPDAVGKAGNGWGYIPWMKGGCYFIVDGSYYWIPSGATITVSKNADGTLKFKASGTFQDESYADVSAGLLLNNVAKQ